MNPEIGQDFVINYWITNNGEDINYSSGQKTIYVAASKSVNTTIALNSPSAVGSYRLKALVSWIGGTATAYDAFYVNATNQNDTGGGGGGGGEPEENQTNLSEITGQVINAPLHLFDVKVVLLEDSLIVKSGDNAVAKIIVYNFGSDEVLDSKVDYWIEDPLGNKIASGYETVAVFTRLEIVKELKIPENAVSGTYFFGAEAHYANQTANGKTFFTVINGESTTIQLVRINQNLLWILILILLLILIVLIIKCLNDNKKRSILPQIGKNKSSKEESVIEFINPVQLEKNEKEINILEEKGVVPIKIEEKKISDIKGLNVCTNGGFIIGKVEDAYVQDYKIYGWLIRLNSLLSGRLSSRYILVKHGHFRSSGDVVIIDHAVLESLGIDS
jgi:sporulation protein YlmC with PRC-barrel domain